MLLKPPRVYVVLTGAYALLFAVLIVFSSLDIMVLGALALGLGIVGWATVYWMTQRN